jgi:hypothetical protein
MWEAKTNQQKQPERVRPTGHPLAGKSKLMPLTALPSAFQKLNYTLIVIRNRHSG